MLLAQWPGLCLGGYELLWLSLVSSTFTAFAIAQSTGSGKCSDVHLFLARGDQEDYPGRLGQISTDVCNDFGAAGTCDYEDIVFTSLVSTSYCDSCFQGSNNGITQVQAYNKKCPKAILVLAGYSLGAQVVGNMLGGGGGHFYNCQEGTITSPFDPNSAPGNMAGALLLGDTRHVANQPYNVGTGSNLPGQYPRVGAQLMSLNRFSSVIQNYCLITDPICAGGEDGGSHTTYMDVFGAQAGNWTVSSIQAVKAKVEGGGSGASSSSSATFSSTSSQSSTLSTTTSSSSLSSSTSSTATTDTTTSPSTETGTSTPSSNPGGTVHRLSDGAKAGIAVGVIAFAALLALSTFFLWRRRQQQQARYADARGTAEAGAAGTVREKENAGGDAIATPDTGSTEVPDGEGLAKLESGARTDTEPATHLGAVGGPRALGAGVTGNMDN